MVLAKHFNVEPPFRYVQAPAIDAIDAEFFGEVLSHFGFTSSQGRVYQHQVHDSNIRVPWLIFVGVLSSLIRLKTSFFSAICGWVLFC